MSHDQHLEREVIRLRKALKFLIGKVHAAAKEIQAEVKLAGESNAAKRVGDQAILLEAHALTTETVFKTRS